MCVCMSVSLSLSTGSMISLIFTNLAKHQNFLKGFLGWNVNFSASYAYNLIFWIYHSIGKIVILSGIEIKFKGLNWTEKRKRCLYIEILSWESVLPDKCKFIVQRYFESILHLYRINFFLELSPLSLHFFFFEGAKKNEHLRF